MIGAVPSNGQGLEAVKRKIEEMRAKSGARPDQSTPTKGKK
jgi:hypothetical protein